jgi:hypothetical protein
VRLSVVGLARIYLLCSSAAAVEERSSSSSLVLKISFIPESKKEAANAAAVLFLLVPGPVNREIMRKSQHTLDAQCGWLRWRHTGILKVAERKNLSISRRQQKSPACVCVWLCNARNCILAGMFFCWIIYILSAAGLKSHLMWKTITV